MPSSFTLLRSQPHDVSAPKTGAVQTQLLLHYTSRLPEKNEVNELILECMVQQLHLLYPKEKTIL